MTKQETSKLTLADGYAFGTFQSWKKDLGKKSGKPYVRVGVLIGKTVHEFFDTVPSGATLDSLKRPEWPIGTLMVVHQPDFSANQGGHINASCTKLEPVIG